MASQFPFDPYYDDFNEDNNFHKILFKPTLPVQARELTQLQSILQDQIKKFGDHVFKHGSVVIPGNSFADLASSYVKLQPTTQNLEEVEGSIVLGTLTGIRAIVRKIAAQTTTDPLTFYLSYLRGGNNGEREFQPDEVLQVEGTNILLTVQTTDPTGTGSMAFVNRGVFYCRGTFVTVLPQSVIIDKYDSSPSARVVFRIQEDIITADEDLTLLDPAQGSFNFAAPGADRHRIQLILESLPLSEELTDDYIEIMRYNEGNLEEHSRYPKYNELEKSIARRTFDESGNYVVNGLEIDIKEHLKLDLNNGVFPAPVGNRDKFVARVSEGKAYIQGFEVEKPGFTDLILDKGRVANHIKTRSNVSLQPKYGQYLFVSNLLGFPSIARQTEVTLWNDANPANGAATQVGSARVIAIDYQEGDPASQAAVYQLFFSNLTLNPGASLEDVGGVRFSGGSMRVLQRLTVPGTVVDFQVGETVNFNSNVRRAIVHRWTRSTSTLFVYKGTHTLATPRLGDTIIGATSNANGTITDKVFSVTNEDSASIIRLPVDSTRRVRNALNIPDITYKSYRELVVATNGSGNGSVTVSGQTIDPIEAGNILIVGASGVVSPSVASLNPAGTELTITGGPVSTTLTVICSVTKQGLAGKNKTLVRTTLNVGSPTTTISLGKADIFRLVSVIDGTGDITSRYRLDNGQRDYAYLLGSITNAGAAPAGAVSITFDYFEHDISGDYFSADSYEGTLGVDYLTQIPTYRSRSSGVEYDLKNCLDFRPRIGDTGSFSVATARTIDLVQFNSRIVTSLQYFVPRIDSVFVAKDGRIGVVTGEPADTPRVPVVPETTMPLATIRVEAYTETLNDISVTKAKNRVYTMSDVGKIEDRLFNLEQFSLLSQTENNLVNFEIVDSATGLTRFKSGYLVDTFLNPDQVSDIYSEEFTVTYADGKIIPRTDVAQSTMVRTASSNNFRITGDIATLPYTEVVFAEQPLSSRVTNVNPFAVYVWSGDMNLTPSFDNWVEVEYLPRVFNTTNESVSATVRRPWNWAPPAGSNAQFIAPPRPIARINDVWDGGTGGPGGDSGDGGGGGGGGGGKIICTELFAKGLMDLTTFEADQAFGALLAEKEPLVMKGYHAWAEIVVDWMRGEGPDMFFWIKDAEEKKARTKNWATSWAYEIATPWAEHMAYVMGKRDIDNKIGAKLMKIGKFVSSVVGRFAKAKIKAKAGRLAGLGCIVVFTGLYLLIRVMKSFQDTGINTQNGDKNV